MTLTITGPTLIGSPCGHHGQYTFYKAFKYQSRTKAKIVMLGEFFFLRISPHDDPCIGELQLLWEDRNSDQLLSSTRLYFLPEQTPDGRQPNHGEHEVLAASDKVILRLSDLVSWITDQVDWMTGLRTQTIVTNTTNLTNILPTINNNNSDSDQNNKHQCHSSNHSSNQTLNQSLHPIAINSGLDFNDVIHEKQVNGDVNSSSSVIVLSYPRYCRYRALLRRIEGKENEWMNKESVQLSINSLGIPTTTCKLNILFCRDTFEHEALLHNDLNCDHLAPKLKGRPRKKQPVTKTECQRSSSPESNTSDESKTSQIRTTRRSALNRNNTNEKSIRTNVVKNSNKVNNNKLKDICIKNEQTFLKQLNKFMRERKTPIQRVPHLGFKQIDLYFFYTHAQKLGGYDKITSNKLWKKLYDEMGGDPGSTSAATCTRRHYERLLLPFERHLNNDTDKKTRRKTTSSSSTAKKGKKQRQRNSDNSNSNTIKKKVGKQVVNGVKGKNKCEEENYSDSTPEKKQLNDEPKQPKLIVKLNLLKVKTQDKSLSVCENKSNEKQIKDELVDEPESQVVKHESQVNDNGSDTEDTDNDTKDLKREDLTEEEEPVEENQSLEHEDSKTSANNEAVMHLSPVSDISNDEEIPVCDNKIEPTTDSPLSTTQTLVQSQPLVPENKSDSNASSLTHPIACTTATAPLPFPVAASPLFSISTLVNSVKAEMVSPPPLSVTTQAQIQTQTSVNPIISMTPKPDTMSSSFHIKRTSYDIYQRRPSVIHKTSNPMFTSSDIQTKQHMFDNKNKSSVPLPAHSSYKNECQQKITIESACNDVLDLSVKKRYLEADSRTSPSQTLTDGSYGLDLSVKKKRIDSPKLQLQVPKAKSDHKLTTPLTLSSLATSVTSNPHKQCPQPLDNVPQSVHKPLQNYHKALPYIDSHAKLQPKQHKPHHNLREQLDKQHSAHQQIVKPQVIHPSQVSAVSQSSHHNNHRQQSHHSSIQQTRQRHSPHIENELSAKVLQQSLLSSIPQYSTQVCPSISDYNPSLPAFNPSFYTSPNFWWQNPNNISSPNPYMSSPIGPLSPHLMSSHPMMPSASYPSDHMLSQIESVKAANFAAYKQFLDQQQQQQQHPYNFFQHINNFYATK